MSAEQKVRQAWKEYEDLDIRLSDASPGEVPTPTLEEAFKKGYYAGIRDWLLMEEPT